MSPKPGRVHWPELEAERTPEERADAMGLHGLEVRVESISDPVTSGAPITMAALRELPALLDRQVFGPPCAWVPTEHERRILISQGFHPGRVFISQLIRPGGERRRRVMEGID